MSEDASWSAAYSVKLDWAMIASRRRRLVVASVLSPVASDNK